MNIWPWLHNLHLAASVLSTSSSEIHLKLVKNPKFSISSNLIIVDFPGGSDGKESACDAGGPGLIPGLRTSPGKGNGNPLQYSCLEDSMDSGAWQATDYGVSKSQKWLSD